MPVQDGNNEEGSRNKEDKVFFLISYFLNFNTTNKYFGKNHTLIQ